LVQNANLRKNRCQVVVELGTERVFVSIDIATSEEVVVCATAVPSLKQVSFECTFGVTDGDGIKEGSRFVGSTIEWAASEERGANKELNVSLILLWTGNSESPRRSVLDSLPVSSRSLRVSLQIISSIADVQ
jgi:hypothetical protein